MFLVCRASPMLDRSDQFTSNVKGYYVWLELYCWFIQTDKSVKTTVECVGMFRSCPTTTSSCKFNNFVRSPAASLWSPHTSPRLRGGAVRVWEGYVCVCVCVCWGGGKYFPLNLTPTPVILSFPRKQSSVPQWRNLPLGYLSVMCSLFTRVTPGRSPVSCQQSCFINSVILYRLRDSLLSVRSYWHCRWILLRIKKNKGGHMTTTTKATFVCTQTFVCIKWEVIDSVIEYCHSRS